nr:NAD-dependent epimerase/dehydratase family protein [Acidimicrobiia bacterium]
MTTADVAITGGSGLVGGHLLSTLVKGGRAVRAIVRSDAAARRVEELGAEAIVADLFDHDSFRDAVWGVPVLYHVAGVNETCPSDARWMDHVNIDGTRAVVAAAADAGVGRVVYTSSAAAIGEANGMVGTEATRHSGTYLSRYARSKHRAEIAAFEAAGEHGVDLVAVSPSSVQGPGRSGGSAKILLYALRAKRPLLVDVKVSLVDIEDCTAGHLAAAEQGRSGERYLLSGSTTSVPDLVAMAGSAGA